MAQDQFSSFLMTLSGTNKYANRFTIGFAQIGASFLTSKLVQPHMLSKTAKTHMEF
jgi:hypothetical protein